MKGTMVKKKVLILGKLPPPFIGPSIATQILLRSALKERFELLHLDTRINDELSSFGKISLRKIIKNFSLYGKMAALIKTHRPDLVLVPISQTRTGFLKDSVFVRIAARQGIKTLVHLRGSEFRNWYEGASPTLQKRIRNVLEKCEGAIVLGEKLRPIFSGFFDESKIFVVPNGADYSFPPKGSGQKIKVLYFSNLLASKGVVDVIKAIDLLDASEKQRIECTLVGAWYKTEDRMECERYMKGRELPLKIFPPASGEKKMQFFADADIFVFPPREPEGHPWCIVEAMAAGLPVISTDKGAITESVHEGVNGFIVQPGNPADLASKLRLLIADAGMRKKMGEEGRRIYLADFTEEKMVDRLSGVFKEVING